MSAPHFCNFCKNHGVPTRFTYAHKFSCPWSECACELCNRLRQRNHYRRTLATSRRNAATSATCTATTAAGGASAVPMVANGTKPTGATSLAAARAAKTKRLKDEQKTSEMNEFVNNYMGTLTDEEKKLPFITNHARALKAYQQQQTKSQPPVLQPDVCREPSDIMALLELEDVFPHIHFTTLQELYNDCGGNTSQVANFLTEDTAINLSDDVCSPVLNFNTRCDDLPSSSTYEVDSLSALLSSPSVHSEGRRPFRCPHCGHTYPSGDYRFCPHCGHPLQGRPRL